MPPSLIWALPLVFAGQVEVRAEPAAVRRIDPGTQIALRPQAVLRDKLIEAPVYELGPAEMRQVLEPSHAAPRPSGSSTRRRSLAAFMPPVRDQGARGSCTAFAAVALLDYFDGADYSEQCLSYLSSTVDGGHTVDRLAYARQHGLFREAECPYDEEDRTRVPDTTRLTPSFFPEEPEVFAASEMEDPIDYIRNRIDFASPVAIEVWMVDQAGWFQDDGRDGFIDVPSEEVIRREFEGGLARGHAVVVTGYDDAWQLLQFRNSWGEAWGAGGYGYMRYDYYLRFRKDDVISY